MATPIVNLEFARGDDAIFSLQFKNKLTGNPIDITGYIIFLTVKEKLSTADADAEVKIDQSTHVNPVLGLSQVKIPHTTTDLLKKEYYYDMQYITPADIVLTYMKGKVWFNKDVTRRIAPL